MIGTLVNTAAVLCGGVIGLLLKKRMPERVTTIYFQAIGLFTLAIGANMAVGMEKILIVVSSLAIGSLLGEWWNLEKGAEQVSDKLKRRFRIGNERFSENFDPCLLLFCGLHANSRYNPGGYRRFSRPALHQIVDGLSSQPSCWHQLSDRELYARHFPSSSFKPSSPCSPVTPETSSAKRSYSDSPMWGAYF